MKSIYNKDEKENLKKAIENESFTINKSIKFNLIKEKKNLKIQRKKIEKRLLILWIFISIISISLYMKYSLSKINKNHISENIYYDNDTIILHAPELYKIETKESNNKIKKYISNSNEKVGVAFVYETMFGNGIGRMLSILFEELAKYEKYDIYLLSKGSYRYDFKVIKK